MDGLVWIYDPKSDSWTKGPECRYGHSALTLLGQVYFFAGTSSQGATNEVWVYDPTANTCTIAHNVL